MPIPFTFATQAGLVPASELDDNFNALVLKSGDTMTGPLVLPGDPTLALQASTKAYVDAKVAAVVSAKTSNYTVVLGDLAKRISCTNSFTLSLTNAAALGNGFLFYVSNDGTGVITIDPSASELINGRSTILVYPGERFQIQCDGAAFSTFGRLSKVLTQTVVTTVAAANFNFETAFADTEFKNVEIAFEAMGVVAGNLAARFKTAGAYDTTNVYFWSTSINNAGTQTGSGSSSATFWNLNTAGVVSAQQGRFVVNRLRNIANGAPIIQCNMVDFNYNLVLAFGGWQGIPANIQGIQFISSTGGNIGGNAGGVAYVYGNRDSD